MVLGARGLSSLEKLVFGSISQGVLSEGCCPTLVVKKPITEVKRVLLPLKGPEDAAAAYAFLEKKPFGPSTQITVVTIPTSARDAAQKLVDDAASRISSISSLGYSASASIVTGIPGGAIVNSRQKCNLTLFSWVPMEGVVFIDSARQRFRNGPA